MNFLISLLFIVCLVDRSLVGNTSGTDWTCRDDNCSKPLGLAEVVESLTKDDGSEELPAGLEIEVYAKELVQDNPRWEVDLNGTKRFLDSRILREVKALSRDHITVSRNIPEEGSQPLPKDSLINPTPSFEVVDGTTIPLGITDGPFNASFTTPPSVELPASDKGSKKDVVESPSKSEEKNPTGPQVQESVKVTVSEEVSQGKSRDEAKPLPSTSLNENFSASVKDDDSGAVVEDEISVESPSSKEEEVPSTEPTSSPLPSNAEISETVTSRTPSETPESTEDAKVPLEEPYFMGYTGPTTPRTEVVTKPPVGLKVSSEYLEEVTVTPSPSPSKDNVSKETATSPETSPKPHGTSHSSTGVADPPAEKPEAVNPQKPLNGHPGTLGMLGMGTHAPPSSNEGSHSPSNAPPPLNQPSEVPHLEVHPNNKFFSPPLMARKLGKKPPKPLEPLGWPGERFQPATEVTGGSEPSLPTIEAPIMFQPLKEEAFLSAAEAPLAPSSVKEDSLGSGTKSSPADTVAPVVSQTVNEDSSKSSTESPLASQDPALSQPVKNDSLTSTESTVSATETTQTVKEDSLKSSTESPLASQDPALSQPVKNDSLTSTESTVSATETTQTVKEDSLKSTESPLASKDPTLSQPVKNDSLTSTESSVLAPETPVVAQTVNEDSLESSTKSPSASEAPALSQPVEDPLLSTGSSVPTTEAPVVPDVKEKVFPESSSLATDTLHGSQPLDEMNIDRFTTPSYYPASVSPYPGEETAALPSASVELQDPAPAPESVSPDVSVEHTTDPTPVEESGSSPTLEEEETSQSPSLDSPQISPKQEEAFSIADYFSSAVNSIKELFTFTETPKEDSNDEKPVSQESSTEIPSNAFCQKEPVTCEPSAAQMETVIREAELTPENSFFGLSMETIILLVITSVVVLIFSLGHYYLENSKRDGDLVAKINTLQSELFVIKKEHAMMDDAISEANEKAKLMTAKVKEKERMMSGLERAMGEIKDQKTTLEDTLARQEKEIETLMENGLEMHRLLSETISEEERSQMLLANIAELKEALDGKLNEIVSLTEQLDQKNQEIQLLNLDLQKASGKHQELEGKLGSHKDEAKEMVLQASERLKEQIHSLEISLEEKTMDATRLEAEVARLKGRCDSLTVRTEVAEKGLKEAHGVKSQEALERWLEVSATKENLVAAEKEIEKLLGVRNEFESSKKNLLEKLEGSNAELKSLHEKYEAAEKEKIDALTKLQVLSNYFKEKETQLQEELGLKESQWLQRETEDHTIYEQMKALREENSSYKSQNDILKKEIIDQEVALKAQFSAESKKAQEHWISYRQAERRLKEAQGEASQLRQMLTSIESSSNQSLDNKSNPGILDPLGETNGFQPAASPPFMLFPREFIPPPPLPSAPTRPPPLGRISSPPLLDFTPPPPLYDIYSSSSPPPPPLHKPQPRDGKREQKESVSSNYSSESMGEKPVRGEKPLRRGKR